MSEYLKVLAKMAKKWAKVIGEGKSLQRNITLKKYVRKGIPGEHRGLVIYITKFSLFYFEYLMQGKKLDRCRYGLLWAVEKTWEMHRQIFIKSYCCHPIMRKLLRLLKLISQEHFQTISSLITRKISSINYIMFCWLLLIKIKLLDIAR